jgi:hypothetical protein
VRRGLPLSPYNLPPGCRLSDLEGRSLRAINLSDDEPEEDADWGDDQDDPRHENTHCGSSFTVGSEPGKKAKTTAGKVVEESISGCLREPPA